jgi:hypothetical protein
MLDRAVVDPAFQIAKGLCMDLVFGTIFERSFAARKLDDAHAALPWPRCNTRGRGSGGTAPHRSAQSLEVAKNQPVGAKVIFLCELA